MFKHKKVQTWNPNHIILLFLAILSIIVLLILWKKETQKEYQDISLFFSNLKYLKMDQEIRKIISSQPLKKKLKQTISLLIQGPNSYQLRPLVPFKTQILSLWYVNGTLYVNFSKELILKQNPKVKDPHLVVYSILASLFYSFPQIQIVQLYIESVLLKTFSGQYIFHPNYTKTLTLTKIKPFLVQYNANMSNFP